MWPKITQSRNQLQKSNYFGYNFHVNSSRWPNIEEAFDADATNIWTDLYFCFQSEVSGTRQQILTFSTHNYFIICLEEIKPVLFRMNWYQIYIILFLFSDIHCRTYSLNTDDELMNWTSSVVQIISFTKWWLLEFIRCVLTFKSIKVDCP